VKPDNILLDKDTGRAMLTDFGIASVVGSATASRAGEILGTAHYMSPEQATAAPLDGRSDLFSLGVTAFYSLTGRLPFEGPHLPAIVRRIVSEPAPRLSDARPSVPPALADAVDKCLAKRANDRFASGEELAEAIGNAVVTNEVAPQLRYFIKSLAQLDLLVFYLWLTIAAVPAMFSALWPKDRITVIYIALTVVSPIVVSVTSLLRATRHLIKAGLGPADVVLAFEREVRARREEAESVALVGPVASVNLERRRRRWLMIGHVSAVVSVASIIATKLTHSFADPRTFLTIGIPLGALAGLSYLAASALKRMMKKAAEGVTPKFLGIGRAEQLVTSWVMPWLFRVAGRGLNVRQQNEPPARERTEVLIAAAVSDLFTRLPRELQARFADVPGVIHRLEIEAERLRARQDASGPVSADARAHARERLASAVAALESLRLDMLRLESGIATPDDLTVTFERARAISDAVDAEIRAAADVGALLPRSQVTSTTL
jgi:serine/threonine-protein kinase